LFDDSKLSPATAGASAASPPDTSGDIDSIAALLSSVYGVLVATCGTAAPWWTAVEVARTVVLSPALSAVLKGALPPTADIAYEWSGYIVLTVVEVRGVCEHTLPACDCLPVTACL
jgi:hypothetical protein